jgi:hypothetical protein
LPLHSKDVSSDLNVQIGLSREGENLSVLLHVVQMSGIRLPGLTRNLLLCAAHLSKVQSFQPYACCCCCCSVIITHLQHHHHAFEFFPSRIIL